MGAWADFVHIVLRIQARSFGRFQTTDWAFGEGKICWGDGFGKGVRLLFLHIIFFLKSISCIL